MNKASSVLARLTLFAIWQLIFPGVFETAAFLAPTRLPSRAFVSSRGSISILNAAAEETTVVGVVAPLHSIGPYPCLSLRFPNVEQDQITTREFALDTGANINSMDEAIVQQLNLPALSGESISARIGAVLFAPGDIYLLGDCELAGLPQTFTFMTGLTVAALPSPGAICDGRLSIPLFTSFPAGVAFEWYGTRGDPPTVSFYYGQDLPEQVRPGLQRVPLERLPTDILTLSVLVNGVPLSAVLDTGSPVTVLSPQAAEMAGIALGPIQDEDVDTALLQSVAPVSIQTGNGINLGQGPVYVGELPVMDQLREIDEQLSSLPGIILGLDFLRQTYRMVLRAPANEVWFEELR